MALALTGNTRGRVVILHAPGRCPVAGLRHAFYFAGISEDVEERIMPPHLGPRRYGRAAGHRS